MYESVIHPGALYRTKTEEYVHACSLHRILFINQLLVVVVVVVVAVVEATMFFTPRHQGWIWIVLVRAAINVSLD